MGKLRYVRPQITFISTEEIENVSPLLMSGGCYSSCYSTCYSSCYTSCYTAPVRNGVVAVFLNNVSFPLGHVALGVMINNRSYEIYNFGPWDNRSSLADGAISTIYKDESNYPKSWTDVLDRCQNQSLHLSNERYAYECPGDDGLPYFTEEFNRCFTFSLPETDIAAIENYSITRKHNPGDYNVAARNCLMFVVDAFAAAGYVFVDALGSTCDIFLQPPSAWFITVDRVKKGSTYVTRTNIADFY